MIEKKEYLEEVSKYTLSVFEQIEKKAVKKLSETTSINASTQINVNAFTGHQAVDKFNKISEDNRKCYETLRKEPAICRVKVINEDDSNEIFYIARKYQIPLDGDAKLASYNSSIGRLASVPVGDELLIEINGHEQHYEVIENIRYQPRLSDSIWDSNNNIFENIDYGYLSINSLRALISVHEEDIDSVLDSILAGNDDGLVEGINYQARISMQLRDQPILDKFQDDIFRLPLKNQLLILGPPGTGKTTTLIKRLGQKLDQQFLDDIEKKLVSSSENDLPHEISWLMFTPTDLLKHYVKEAFNREQVPASEQNIKTWDSYSKEFSRNVLNVLQSPTSNGKFVLKNTLDLLDENVLYNPMEWFENFSKFHSKRIFSQFERGVQLLEKHASKDNVKLIDNISTIISDSNEFKLITICRQLESLELLINPLLKQLKKESDTTIRKGLALAVNRNRAFLDELSYFLDSLKIADDTDNDEEFDDDDNEESISTQNSIKKAQKSYNQAIRSLSKAKYIKRNINKSSKTAKIVEWLGERLPSDDMLLEIGKNITIQNGLRRFVNATKRYVSEVPSSYREYRKYSLKQKQFYSSPKRLKPSPLGEQIYL